MIVIESRIINEKAKSSEPQQLEQKFENREAAVRYLNGMILQYRPLSWAYDGTWWIRKTGLLIRFTVVDL